MLLHWCKQNQLTAAAQIFTVNTTVNCLLSCLHFLYHHNCDCLFKFQLYVKYPHGIFAIASLKAERSNIDNQSNNITNGNNNNKTCRHPVVCNTAVTLNEATNVTLNVIVLYFAIPHARRRSWFLRRCRLLHA
jgi:hypothetical protein